MTGTGGTLAGASGKGSELHLADLQMSADGGARLRADSAGLLTIRNSRITLAPGGILAGVAADGVGSRAELYDTYLQGGWFDIDSGGSLLLENVEAHSVGGSMRLLGSTLSKTYSSAVINGGSFFTVGGYGVNINSWGELTARDATFDVREGYSGFWLASDASRLQLTDSSVDTWTDSYGHGVEIYGGTATVQGGRITTHGDATYGVRVRLHRQLRQPHRSHRQRDRCARRRRRRRVHRGSTATALLDSVAIRGDGENVFGIVHMNTARLTQADRLDIRMTGSNSGGYRYLTAFGPYWNRATFNDSHIETASGAAFWLQGSNHALTVKGSEVTAGDGDGRLLRVSDGVHRRQQRGDQPHRLQRRRQHAARRRGGRQRNRRRAPAAGQRHALQWCPAQRFRLPGRAAVAGWQQPMERACQFQRRRARSRRHHRLRCADGGDFKTVTVSGDYVGNGGQWIFNRALGDDTSLGDQLVINSSSSGTASVSVRNAGGAGALTGGHPPDHRGWPVGCTVQPAGPRGCRCLRLLPVQGRRVDPG